MYESLTGMRVIEGASFIAAPSCSLYLLQLGAEVIRFDAIGGGPDYGRWPLGAAGDSLYWEGLNKGKKSIAIDLSRPEGRELACALVTAPGESAGLFVTNYPADGFLAHERLVARRPDLISLRVMGWPDGRNAVDHTVNAVAGFPLMTGPETLGQTPVNHVLPAWDLLAGAYAAFALLAKERERRATGKGGEVRIALGDVAAASLGHLGQVAEATVADAARPRYGNSLFGAFGRDFAARDGRSVMIAAITGRQWTGMVACLGIGAEIAAIEAELGLSFARDEGLRFRHRDRIDPIVAQAVGARDSGELVRALESAGVLCAPYLTTLEAVREQPGFVAGNPLFASVSHPSGHRYPTPGAAAQFVGAARPPVCAAPRLGEHTDEILSHLLGLPDHEIGILHDSGVIAGPAPIPRGGR
jgi:2-methylfumaryl-CoA isomerase